MTEQNQRELHELLGERGRRLGSGGPFSAAEEARVLGTLRAEAEQEDRANKRRPLMVLLGAALATAAALVLFSRLSAVTDFGRSSAELALLDTSGRALSELVRSASEAPTKLPGEVLLELSPTTPGFAAIVMYGKGGERRLPDEGHAWPIEPGSTWTRVYEIEGAGNGLVFLVCLSERPVPPAELRYALPARLPEPSAADLERVATDVEADLGIRVLWRSL